MCPSYILSDLTVHTSAVSVFDQVSLATMAKAQSKDSVLGLVIQYVCKEKTKGLSHLKIGCKDEILHLLLVLRGPMCMFRTCQKLHRGVGLA